jgi:hypothetical protein
MRGSIRKALSVMALIAIVLGCWMLVTSSEALAEGKGTAKTACCDPAHEPGVGDNPFCYEGHTCCSDGQWSCNNPDGSPSCEPGEVCEPGCAKKNEPCDLGEDCCSGICKPNGRCR